MVKAHKICLIFYVSSILFLLSSSASANSIELKVGLGKVSVDNTSPVSKLTSQGYTVNSHQRNKVDKDSNSLGVAYSFSPKLKAELAIQELGKVRSTLDLQLPANKTPQQAAEDVASASSQQTGGLHLVLGASYVQPVSSRINLRAGAGVLVGKNNHLVTVNGEDIDISDNVYAPYIKLGTGIKATRKLSVTAHVERYFLDDPVNRYEIGLHYHFR